jgi:hypothetical protein
VEEVTLRSPATFADQYLAATLAQGFSALSKRDVDLLVFLLLERDGALNRNASNFDIARLLRITPAKVKSLRRDAYARWRPLIGDNRKDQIRRILSEVLTEERIRAGATYASERTQKDGFIAVRLEHADDRQELEQTILDAGGIPVYERNSDVMVLRFDTLLSLADSQGFISRDPKGVRAALKKLAPTTEQVKELLKKDVSDVTWEDVRGAFNAAGADALSGAIDTKVTALLKIALPFLA